MILEEESDPFNGVMKYPFARFIPFLADGHPFGLVDNIKGPQEELNKRRSQVLHNLNSAANSGWKVNSLTNDGRQILENFGSSPGVVLEKTKFGGNIERIDPGRLDKGHFSMAERAEMDIRQISGVNSELMGTDQARDKSGKAMMIRQDAGLTVSQKVFDNYNRTQAELGTFLWEVIRRNDFYSSEEIEAIVTEHTMAAFMTQDPEGGEEPIVDLSVIENWDVGAYGVKVGLGSNSPTMRMAYFDQLLAMAKEGFPIPPDALLSLSEIPNREQIVAQIKASMDAQAKADAEQQKIEQDSKAQT